MAIGLLYDPNSTPYWESIKETYTSSKIKMKLFYLNLLCFNFLLFYFGKKKH